MKEKKLLTSQELAASAEQLRKNKVLSFGDVVERWDLGRGMVYATLVDGTLLVAFERECVSCGIASLDYVGSIHDLGRSPIKMAGVPPQRELE